MRRGCVVACGPGGRGSAWVRWRGSLLLLLLLLAGGAAGGDGGGTNGGSGGRDSLFIVERFEDEPWQELTHLRVDKNTGTVYVGGKDRLYQLDPNLRRLQQVITGPVNDSLDCSASDCKSDTARTMRATHNVNKVLVIDYMRSRLIVCGTVRQGSCQVRDLLDITIHTRNVSQAIVANNATASTVAFIAPGPPNPPVTHVLYIGVTYTSKSVYRDEVPAVASRSLEDDRFFEIAVEDVTTSTRMLVNSLARERYPITYVYGFGSEKFSYFLTRQMESSHTGSPYISKLVRVCQNDSAYYSYTEIPIECKDAQGKRYNLAQAAYVGKPGTDLATQLGIQTNDDVLFAVFSPSDPMEGEGSPRPDTTSALCVYSMKSVRRMFINNIQECFRGKGDRGLDFISPSHTCIPVRINDLNEDFCGMDVNTPLGGEQPVEGLAVLTFSTRLTAVAATSTEVYTVVFLGTAHGHLKKVVIENQNNALEYDDIVVDEGASVRQDMFFDKSANHLYVMTTTKISKVKAQECSMYKGCSRCLGARDPYCGWCSLENKCSLRRDCRGASQDPQHWVSHKTGRCTTVTRVIPNKLQRTTARTLHLTIDNLPSEEGSMQCVFSALGKELTTGAKRTSQGVSCTSPRTDLLPDLPQSEHHFTAKLSVRKLQGQGFEPTNFTFFDCSTYRSCTACVSSPFPCDWCVAGHRCTHDYVENCSDDILVNGVSRMGPSLRSGSSFCPRITFVESQEILISSGFEKSLKVKVANIPQFMTESRFVCMINIAGRTTSATAHLLSDTVYCGQMEFAYSTPVPYINATFAVIWGGSKPLDNPDNIHVVVYKCHLMADNCGMCLTLPERYGCGWCQSTKQCEVVNQCDSNGGSSWLDRDRTCPDIIIKDFSPKSGPWEGGTNITINGINLGKKYEDISEGITVAGLSCQPHRESYIRTKRVTCVVDSPGLRDHREGWLVVRVTGDYRGESSDKYRFVNPEIQGLSPESGPRSGGSLLHILGTHMNAGSTIRAFVSGRPCEIKSTNATVATCLTPPSASLVESSISMNFDNGRRVLDGKFFTYVADPQITAVKSGRAGQTTLRYGAAGIPAGGITLTVDGTNLDVIREPRIYVVYKEQEFTSPCMVLSATRMECLSPALTRNSGEVIPEEGLQLNYGFIMDGVTSLRDIDQRRDFRPFTMFPNPVFNAFTSTNRVKHVSTSYLMISGQHLNLAAQEVDVVVEVGALLCDPVSLSRSLIFCQLPPSQPPATGEDIYPRVVVKVGNNLQQHLGFIKYQRTSANRQVRSALPLDVQDEDRKVGRLHQPS